MIMLLALVLLGADPAPRLVIRSAFEVPSLRIVVYPATMTGVEVIAAPQQPEQNPTSGGLSQRGLPGLAVGDRILLFQVGEAPPAVIGYGPIELLEEFAAGGKRTARRILIYRPSDRTTHWLYMKADLD